MSGPDNLVYDVVVKWPGSVHDAGIFDLSDIKRKLEEEKLGTLLGDSGYPLRHYLLTPILNALNADQEYYNDNLKSARTKAEHTYGILKMRYMFEVGVMTTSIPV